MAALSIFDFQNYFIFTFLCLFTILIYSLFFKKSKLGFALPPSPPSLPIIGHLHHLLSFQIHKSLQKLSSKYGPILYLRLFNVPIVLVSSASVASEIFKGQDVNVSARNLPTNEGSLFFGSLGFTTAPYGDYWKFTKKLIVTKLLGPQALERSRGVRGHEVERFYSNLLDKAMRKESIEIVEEAMKLINNIICKILMGRTCSEENGEAAKVRGLVSESDSVSMKFILAAMLRKPLGKFGISPFQKELVSLSTRFDEVLEKILLEYQDKINEHHQSTDMMDALLTACGDENAEYKITRNHIKSLLVELLVAATDTSAHAIQWTMAELINNPNILERLRKEINVVVGKSRLVQETDLPNIPYLQAVVKEGLRLHPPVAFLVRAFQESCEIKDFYIPEKTRLVVNVYDVMRDADTWEDPEEFKPERFLVSSRSWQEDEIRAEFLKYIPFGSGRRGCPGSNLSYLSIGVAIGVMVQCFDWKFQGDKVNMEEVGGALTLIMANPFKCTLIPRTLNL